METDLEGAVSAQPNRFRALVAIRVTGAFVFGDAAGLTSIYPKSQLNRNPNSIEIPTQSKCQIRRTST